MSKILYCAACRSGINNGEQESVGRLCRNGHLICMQCTGEVNGVCRMCGDPNIFAIQIDLMNPLTEELSLQSDLQTLTCTAGKNTEIDTMRLEIKPAEREVMKQDSQQPQNNSIELQNNANALTNNTILVDLINNKVSKLNVSDTVANAGTSAPPSGELQNQQHTISNISKAVNTDTPTATAEMPTTSKAARNQLILSAFEHHIKVQNNLLEKIIKLQSINSNRNKEAVERQISSSHPVQNPKKPLDESRLTSTVIDQPVPANNANFEELISDESFKTLQMDYNRLLEENLKLAVENSILVLTIAEQEKLRRQSTENNNPSTKVITQSEPALELSKNEAESTLAQEKVNENSTALDTPHISPSIEPDVEEVTNTVASKPNYVYGCNCCFQYHAQYPLTDDETQSDTKLQIKNNNIDKSKTLNFKLDQCLQHTSGATNLQNTISKSDLEEANSNHSLNNCSTMQSEPVTYEHKKSKTENPRKLSHRNKHNKKQDNTDDIAKSNNMTAVDDTESSDTGFHFIDKLQSYVKILDVKCREQRKRISKSPLKLLEYSKEFNMEHLIDSICENTNSPRRQKRVYIKESHAALRENNKLRKVKEEIENIKRKECESYKRMQRKQLNKKLLAEKTHRISKAVQTRKFVLRSSNSQRLIAKMVSHCVRAYYRPCSTNGKKNIIVDEKYPVKQFEVIKYPSNSPEVLAILARQRVCPKSLGADELNISYWPLKCPLHCCTTRCFVTDFTKHLAIDHGFLPMERTKPRKPKNFFIDARIALSDIPSCQMVYLVRDKVSGIGRGIYSAYLPVMVMTARIRLSEIIGDTEGINAGNDTTFLMVWLSTLVSANYPLSASLTLWARTGRYPKCHIVYSGRIYSLGSPQDKKKVFESGQHLLITPQQLIWLLDDKNNALQMQLFVH